ncbi:MAG: DUF4097 family beta strand repeat-containing protein [Planctomycetota bacterium]
MPRALLPLAVLLLPLLPSAGCVVVIGGDSRSGPWVDGRRLAERHEEVLLAGAWDPAGLAVESAFGDLRVEPTAGENRIRVVLWEEVPGDATAVYENGRLSSRSRGGLRTALGEVTVFARDPLPSLALATGQGDLALGGVAVAGNVCLRTGQGDIDLAELGETGEVAISTGQGDAAVAGATCARVEVRTGQGDLALARVQAGEVELTTGAGDVEVDSCQLERLAVRTGLGDIDVRNTHYGTGELTTGLGRVRGG